MTSCPDPVHMYLFDVARGFRAHIEASSWQGRDRPNPDRVVNLRRATLLRRNVLFGLLFHANPDQFLRGGK